MSVDWGKVQTNVVSALVVGLVGSAVAVVWTGATTVDEKVDKAVMAVESHHESLREQTEYVQKAVELLQQELSESRQRDNEIMEALEQLQGAKSTSFKKPDILEKNFIKSRLPEINVQQIYPVHMPRE